MKLLKKILGIIYRHCFDSHTAVSNSVKKYLSNHFDLDHVDVITNGFDIEKILEESRSRKEKSPVPEKILGRFSHIAVTPGRLIKEKGHLILIDAISLKREEMADTLFLFVGHLPNILR